MASLIHEIENNESLFLMYTSGELSAEDNAEVEQMLAGDPGMRAELASISSAYEYAMTALSELDADRSLVAGENHAIRQAQRAMKQWQIERVNRQPVKMAQPRRRIPGWAYGSAVAAMLLIGTLTYWGVVGDPSSANDALATRTGESEKRGDGRLIGDSMAQLERDKTDLLERSLVSPSAPSIDDAELQASTLLARSDNEPATSILLIDPGQ